MSHRFVARSSLGGACHGAPGFAKLAGRGSGAHRVPSVDRARGSFCEPAPCTMAWRSKADLPLDMLLFTKRLGIIVLVSELALRTLFPRWLKVMRFAAEVSWSANRSRASRAIRSVALLEWSWQATAAWTSTRCGSAGDDAAVSHAPSCSSDGGRRRFLLHRDHDGRTWVTVAAPLRRMPRRHRRGSHRRSPPLHCSAVARPVSRQSHISVSSEDDFVDDDHADFSADIQGLHEEDPTGDSADPDFQCEDVPSGDLVYDHEVKMENEVKTEEVPVDAGSVPPTVPDVRSPARMSRWIPRRMLCFLRRFLLSRYHLSLLFLLWNPGLHRFR